MNTPSRVNSAGAAAVASGAAAVASSALFPADTSRLSPQASSSHGNSTTNSSSLGREFCASGISVGCANIFLNPVEVVKTRMMLARAQASSPAAPTATTTTCSLRMPMLAGVGSTGGTLLLHPPALAANPYQTTPPGPSSCCGPRLGFIATGRHIVASEGMAALARGVQPAAARALLNGGIRLGLYNPIKDAISRNSSSSSSNGSGTSNKQQQLSMGAKLAAGLASGAIGAATTSPLELIKTRLQAPNPQHTTAGAVVRHMYSQHGLPGLWRGCSPGVVRVMLLNGFMVATYDEVKTHVTRHTGWSASSLAATLVSSCISGVVTTTAINPVDVVRSYIQTGRGVGSWAVARRILQQEGPMAFFKGWSAAYARTGPQTVIIFAVAEVVRPLFGLKAIA